LWPNLSLFTYTININIASKFSGVKIIEMASMFAAWLSKSTQSTPENLVCFFVRQMADNHTVNLDGFPAERSREFNRIEFAKNSSTSSIGRLTNTVSPSSA
jgi:hypothetical protein